MDLLFLQNVLGKITHGLIGFDLRLQNKDGSKYLEDFLSLKDEELDAACEFATFTTGFLPGNAEFLSKEKQELKEAVQRARMAIGEINQKEKQELEQIIYNLCDKMEFLYQGIGVKGTTVIQR